MLVRNDFVDMQIDRDGRVISLSVGKTHCVSETELTWLKRFYRNLIVSVDTEQKQSVINKKDFVNFTDIQEIKETVKKKKEKKNKINKK